VVEVELEAKLTEVELLPGKKTTMWTYNGVLPGPRIEAKVGDTVRVRLKNSLPEATTIHWHGLRVPADQDGVPVTQTPIAPGASFTYEFVVSDAGTFWYHPHIRGDEQVERGLYGSFVVRGPDEPPATAEQVVLLDDVLIDERGQLLPFSDAQSMIGRQGNLILANGIPNPVWKMRPGGAYRLRFINTANSRYFRLALPRKKLMHIATDGGLLESAREVEELLLVPGERADLWVVADSDAGAASAWRSLRYDRGHGTGEQGDIELFQSRVEGAPAQASALPAKLATLAPLPQATTTRTLILEESAAGDDPHAGHGATSSMATVFSINGEIYPKSTPLSAKLGTVEDWIIKNVTEMDHPFHLHGFRFQIIAQNDQSVVDLSWRDTINIPAQSSTTFRVRLETNPGEWMFHCHILEHAERGMMGSIEVLP
jgi:FtsP/CotA-like multicopper oxidase with cupredoxin domain